MRNCINHLFELIKAREQESLVQLLAFLVQKKAISKDDFVATLEKLTSQLEDLRWVSCLLPPLQAFLVPCPARLAVCCLSCSQPGHYM